MEADRSTDVGVDLAVSLEADRAADVGVDQAVSLEADRATDVGVDLTVSLEADRATDVGVDLAVSLEADRATDVGVDLAVSLEADRATDVGVDLAVSRVADRAADLDVDPAVLVGADGAAHVGVGVTMDEAVRADVTAEGDVEPKTRKPAPGGPVDCDRLGEMTYIVQMPASSVRSFPVSQPEMSSCEESIGDSHRRSRLPVRSGSPVLACPQLPDQVREEQSRLPVRHSPTEPVQPS